MEKDCAACPAGICCLPISWTMGMPHWVSSSTLRRNGRSPKPSRISQQASPSAQTRNPRREPLVTQASRKSKPWDLSSRGARKASIRSFYSLSKKTALFLSCNPYFWLGRAPTRTSTVRSFPSGGRSQSKGSLRSCDSRRSILPRIPPFWETRG